MKNTKEELEIAKQIQLIIESKIHNKNKDVWKENWIWCKEEIKNNLEHQKQLLIEEQELGLQISQLRTEGYISALDWLLFTFDNYEQDDN
jgi:hypothetical protein